MATQRLRQRSPYVLLAIVALLTVPAQIGFSRLTIEALAWPDRQPDSPLGLKSDGTIRALEPAAEAAGLRLGDRLIAVEGAPVRGLAGYLAPLARRRPGDVIHLTVERRGTRVDAAVALAAPTAPASLAWFFPLLRDFFIPGVCLPLGFIVALIRVRDPRAWLLLALMICFACMIDSPLNIRAAAWGPVVRDVVVFVRIFLSLSWAAAMLLFGVYFPERLALDRRIPWLKWLIVAPALAVAALAAFYYTALLEDFPLAQRLESALVAVRAWPFLLMISSASLFFWAIWYKRAITPPGDGKRRLNLLAAGTTTAMAPLLPLVLIANLSGKPLLQAFPLWVVAAALGMLILFPLTMAYVIVVQRALDLRAVLRQGVRYALATRAVGLLRLLITVLTIVYAMNVIQAGRLTQAMAITTMALSALVVLGARRGAASLSRWVDRRFFREAYSAEKILGELSDKVRSIVETDKLVETVAQHVAGSLHIQVVHVLLQQGDEYRAGDLACFPAAGGVVGHLRATARPALVYLDDEKSWLWKGPVGAAEAETLRALQAQALVPLFAAEKMPGIVVLGPKLSDQPYSPSDLNLLQSVAGQVGLALENSRLTAEVAGEVARRELLRREVAIAREVQQRLFPQRLPPVPGISYTGHCRPASEVGGDYFDFLELPDGRFGFAVGDVSGKGIPAALLMASLQASLRGQAISGAPDLARLMQNLNRLLYEASPRSHFATVFFGCYDPASRCLSYVNAGHNAPMLARTNGHGPEIIRLSEHGVGAGLTRGALYREARIHLQPGDVLVGFTDGLPEAMNPSREEWGEEGLARAVSALATEPVPAILDGVLAAAEAHAAGAPQHDDMTLVVLRIEPPPAAS